MSFARLWHHVSLLSLSFYIYFKLIIIANVMNIMGTVIIIFSRSRVDLRGILLLLLLIWKVKTWLWPVLFLFSLSPQVCCATFSFPMLAKLKLLLPTCFFFDHMYRMGGNIRREKNIKKIKISKILESKNCCIYCHIRECHRAKDALLWGIYWIYYEMAHSRKFFNCLHFQWNTREMLLHSLFFIIGNTISAKNAWPWEKLSYRFMLSFTIESKIFLEYSNSLLIFIMFFITGREKMINSHLTNSTFLPCASNHHSSF